MEKPLFMGGGRRTKQERSFTDGRPSPQRGFYQGNRKLTRPEEKANAVTSSLSLCPCMNSRRSRRGGLRIPAKREKSGATERSRIVCVLAGKNQEGVLTVLQISRLCTGCTSSHLSILKRDWLGRRSISLRLQRSKVGSGNGRTRTSFTSV